MKPVIKIIDLYKEYKLGVIGRGTLYRDLQSWWAKIRNKEDPNSVIGKADISTLKNKSFLALQDINLEIFEGENEYLPFMNIKKIVDNEFEINNLKILTFKHNHGSIDVQTYRINNFAYTTDFKKFYDNDIDKLKNLDLWIVGLLKHESHPSHASFNEIIELVNYLKPKQTIFTHMTALIDENEILKLCPKNVCPAYDGMEIII